MMCFRGGNQLEITSQNAISLGHILTAVYTVTTATTLTLTGGFDAAADKGHQGTEQRWQRSNVVKTDAAFRLTFSVI